MLLKGEEFLQPVFDVEAPKWTAQETQGCAMQMDNQIKYPSIVVRRGFQDAPTVDPRSVSENLRIRASENLRALRKKLSGHSGRYRGAKPADSANGFDTYVYSMAKEITVWLGEEADNSSGAIDFMELLVDKNYLGPTESSPP